MSILLAMRQFPKQFSYELLISNRRRLKRVSRFIVAGMGGSALAGDFAAAYLPKISIVRHRDYGLPDLDKAILKKNLVIASSYSGNTEETLSAFEAARKRKIPLAAITVGGKLLVLSKKYRLPYIQLPDLGLEPRAALGLSFKALMRFMGTSKTIREIEGLATILKPQNLKGPVRFLVKKLKNRIPLIYSSRRNEALAYFFKITLNETAKIPAFSNVFPELNHNEMVAFEKHELTESLARRFSTLIIADPQDRPRIQKRMKIFKNLYTQLGWPVETVLLQGKTRLLKMFNLALLAEWSAYFLSLEYRVPAEGVALVEQFKRLMARRI